MHENAIKSHFYSVARCCGAFQVKSVEALANFNNLHATSSFSKYFIQQEFPFIRHIMPSPNENRSAEDQARRDRIQILKNTNAELKAIEVALAKELSDAQETSNLLRATLAARQEELDARNRQN